MEGTDEIGRAGAYLDVVLAEVLVAEYWGNISTAETGG